MANQVRATIVGGGIAGLATGVALKRIGYNVRVIEKKKVLDTVPQGLTLQPAAIKALSRVSPALTEKLAKMGQSSGDISLFSSLRNSTIGKLSQQEIIDQYNVPFITVPRQEFYAALVKEFGSDNIVLGKQFKEYFEDRKTGEVTAVCIGGTEYTSDLIIGAEGAYSMISEMIPLPYHNRYRGTTTWAGIAEGVSLDELEGSVGIGFGAQRASGIMPMTEGRVYWWASYGTWYGPEFDPNGDHKALLSDLFREYNHGPLPSLIQRTKQITCQDIYDKTPYPTRVGRGRATLVGDAAHLAAPTFASGADQAIEDAASLAYHLAQKPEFGPNVSPKLRQYENSRYDKPRGLAKFARTANNIFHAQRPVNQYLAAYAASLVFPVFKHRYLDDLLRSNL